MRFSGVPECEAGRHCWTASSVVTFCIRCPAERDRKQWFDARTGRYEYHDAPIPEEEAK